MSELGTDRLGHGMLGTTADFFTMGSATTSNTSTQQLDPTSIVSPSMETTKPTLQDEGLFHPTILDPQNVNVEYNRSKEVFESTWIPTDTFNQSRDQLVAVLSLDQDAKPVNVVIERDLSGDKTADVHSDILTISEDVEIARASPTGERGEYRLVFPTYNQTDVVRRLNIALTYDNTERLIENIPYQFLRNDISKDNFEGGDDIQSLITALGDTLDRIDATIDSVYDNRFVESARGTSLNKLGEPVGIQRRDIGNPERSDDLESDERLRKRVLAAKALVGLDTTSPSFTQLLAVLFPRATTAISIAVATDEPKAEVTIPTNVVSRSPLNSTEIEDILEDGVASSYDVTVTKSGSFNYETESVDDPEWNDGKFVL